MGASVAGGVAGSVTGSVASVTGSDVVSASVLSVFSGVSVSESRSLVS